jgi:hypothetical protein
MAAGPDLRPSPIAGSWYPDDPGSLAASVDGYLQAARLGPLEGEVVAVVAPHAGHVYSGPVAGYAFAALQGLDAGLVAVVGPMHDPAPHPLLTSGHEAYVTPLGLVRVDPAARRRLGDEVRAALGLELVPVRNDAEHALEIELPFLQRALPAGFRLLPLMVRELGPGQAEGLGRALARALEGEAAVLVASTDLSHYYPQALAKRLDAEMLRRIEAFDPEAVLRAEQEGAGFACGIEALAGVLWAARALGADRARILRYATSGDVSGDYTEVVGYGAAVLTRGPSAGQRGGAA